MMAPFIIFDAACVEPVYLVQFDEIDLIVVLYEGKLVLVEQVVLQFSGPPSEQELVVLILEYVAVLSETFTGNSNPWPLCVRMTDNDNNSLKIILDIATMIELQSEK